MLPSHGDLTWLIQVVLTFPLLQISQDSLDFLTDGYFAIAATSRFIVVCYALSIWLNIWQQFERTTSFKSHFHLGFLEKIFSVIFSLKQVRGHVPSVTHISRRVNLGNPRYLMGWGVNFPCAWFIMVYVDRIVQAPRPHTLYCYKFPIVQFYTHFQTGSWEEPWYSHLEREPNEICE